MDSYMTPNGSCCMVNWTIFKSHLLEVGLPQKQETTTSQMLTTVDLLYFIMIGDLACIEIYWKSICLRTQWHTTSHYTWGHVTTLHVVGGGLGRPFNTFFRALTSSQSLTATSTHEPRAVTMRLWEPKRKCPNAVRPKPPPKTCSMVTDPRV